jgi:hypothetical protein
MQQSLKSISSNGLKYLLICVAGFAVAGNVAASGLDRTAVLRAKHASLAEQLRQNQFQRPLVLFSSEAGSRLEGEAYAVVNYSFNAVNTGLNNAGHWCDVLLLHLNTKYCHAESNRSRTTLNVNIGKKTPEELADAVRIEFDYSVGSATPEYFDIRLKGKNGPMGTSDYRILLEAVALPNDKTFLHLTYSYAINMSGRLAMQTYLGTVGSSKVGFSIVGKRDDGRPHYIGGVRGLMERNTMRYYLAIDSFLGAGSVAPAAQPEKRLQDWFTATERYSRQLHEMDRAQYVEMKRAEHLRQQTNHN